MFDLDWKKSPPQIILNRTEVHVWLTSLHQSDAVVQKLAGTLSADETERASRFYFERHRIEFVTARGILRNLMAVYLNCCPEDVNFVYGEKGKPSLAGEHNVRFNLSHSGDLAIYAFTLDRDVGVDIERVRQLDDLDGLAKCNFSQAEVAILRMLPPEMRHEAFFNCWTRKEAYIKALGEGLSHPLDRFDVSFRPGEPARLLQVIDHPGELSRWRLEALPVPQDYVAAIMVEGKDTVIQTWHWDEGRVGTQDDSTIMKNTHI